MTESCCKKGGLIALENPENPLSTLGDITDNLAVLRQLAFLLCLRAGGPILARSAMNSSVLAFASGVRFRFYSITRVPYF